MTLQPFRFSMWSILYEDPDEIRRIMVTDSEPSESDENIIEVHEIKKIPAESIYDAIRDYDKAYQIDVGSGKRVRIRKCPSCLSVFTAERPILADSIVHCNECKQMFKFQPRIVPLF